MTDTLFPTDPPRKTREQTDPMMRAKFHGESFDPEQDGERLKTLLDRVRVLMRDGEWRTLPQIASACGGTEASVSARLRDLRKPENGGHVVHRRRDDESAGLWWYRVEESQ